jgi:hypothetical protein
LEIKGGVEAPLVKKRKQQHQLPRAIQEHRM